VTLRSADDLLIDGRVDSNGGDIYIIAGNAPGMNIPGVAPASEPNDNVGKVSIEARVDASNPAGRGGDIVINATQSVIQKPQGAGGSAGLNNLGSIPSGTNTNSGQLIVRTYNDAPNGAIIDLRHDNNPNGNANGPVTLETRLRNDGSAPNEPGTGYASSNIDYRSYTGVVLKGIGTSADFIAIAATQNIDLDALNIQAKNLTLIANAGDVNVNTQIRNSQINSGKDGGSLNLRASGNVNVNNVPGKNGITIGRIQPGANPSDPDDFDPNTGLPTAEAIEKFDHDLKLVAAGDIKIEGGIFLKGNLNLRADASNAEAVTVGAKPGLGDGIGSVIVQAPLHPTDPVIVSADNITVGTLDANGRPLPVQNLIVKAGDAAAGQHSASASLQAALELKVFLRGNLEMTGGTVTAVAPAQAGKMIENTAAATIGGFTVEIRGIKKSDHSNALALADTNSSNIVLEGGTATATQTGGNRGTATANASAVILSGSTAEIDIGGDVQIKGGIASADGANATARAIAGTEIGTKVTGNQLLTLSAGNIYIDGGMRSELNGGVAEGFGSIASSGAITINLTGTDGIKLTGASGSGLFDALGGNFVRVTGTGYPIDVKGGGAEIIPDPVFNPDRADGLIVAGAPLVDESLLAAFLRATETTRQETLAQDPNLTTNKGGKGAAGVCK
jgi:hypothetical protein